MSKIETVDTKSLIPLDQWTADLYKKYGLGETPSFEEMREIAIKLLANDLTLYPGADIVFAKKVCKDIYERIKDPNMTPDQRFDILVGQKAEEERQRAVPEVGK